MPPGARVPRARLCLRELRDVAAALGEDVAGLSDEQAAERAVEHIRALLKSIGIPATLREWGIDAADFDIPQLVEERDEEPEHRDQPAPGDSGRPRRALPGGAGLKISSAKTHIVDTLIPEEHPCEAAPALGLRSASSPR